MISASDIQYSIVGRDDNELSIVVEYYVPAYPILTRRLNLSLPVDPVTMQVPSGQALADYIMSMAPIGEFEDKLERYNAAPLVNMDSIVISLPPEYPVAMLRRDKLAYINASCDDAIAFLKQGYPDNEVTSWDKQENEAQAYTADNTAATPLLSAIAVGRGITVADLASRVLAKATAFAQSAGSAIGQRQALEDQLNAIANDDPDVVNKITSIKWTPLTGEQK